MFTAETVAQHLHHLALATFDPDGPGGNIFVAHTPDRPDVAVTVSPMGGDIDRAVDEHVLTFQLRARGARGQHSAPILTLANIAVALSAAGYGPPAVWAPGTPYAAKIIAAWCTTPGTMGQDDNGRPEASCRLTVRAAA